MSARVFTGRVGHQRLEPRPHGFAYPVTFFAIDLADLARVDREVVGFGHNRIRPFAIHDRDYLEPAPEPIMAKLRRHLARFGVSDEPARVVLVTAARTWNVVFNPVSFYLVFNAQGVLCRAVAEVNNTFGDRHVYVLPALEREAETGDLCARLPKDFHVSPFNNLEGEYRFRFRVAEDALEIHVDLVREGRPVFRSQLTGRGLPLTTAALWRTCARHPLAPMLTVPRIVAQAARLRYRQHLPVFARPEPTSAQTIMRRPPGGWERWATARVLSLLRRIRHGELRLTMPDGKTLVFGACGGRHAVCVQVRRHAFFTRLVTAGDVGLGEAYMAEDFTCADVPGLLELLIANRRELADGQAALAWLGAAWNRVWHLLRPNTRRLSKRNIHAHYDLGNAFFSIFLDPTMMYSCAQFTRDADTLEAAQHHKIRTLIAKLRLRPADHLLEIGSGWGSFAIEAARQTGCRVTSITVSEEQHRLATERVRVAGLADRVDIRLCDYREMSGPFDRIVSIEMIEAVGHRFLPVFFRQLERLLKPNGLVVLQAITIPDQRYEAYRRGCDWIQKHIFPGGLLPSLAVMTRAMQTQTALQVENLENIGADYATTLRAWTRAFNAGEDRVRALGFDDAFILKWRYYLAYCEAAFASRTLNALQVVLTRPNNADLDPPGG